MFITKLETAFTKSYYVQIRENQIFIRNISDDYSAKKHDHFSHPRMLIGDFAVAQACLKAGFSEVHASRFFYYTSVVIHPMEKLEGGLTLLEERLLREMMASFGASKIVVWVGKPLDDAEVMEKLSSAKKIK